MVMDQKTLENLFRLSNFALEPKDTEQWLADVTQWLAFFSLEDAPDTHASYQFAGLRSVHELRKDANVGQSLTSAEIKLFSKSFVDGFVALPEHKIEK